MYKSNCDNKRMVACAVAEAENHKLINSTLSPITIHMGEYGNINTTMDNIKEQLEKQLRINVCSFNK